MICQIFTGDSVDLSKVDLISAPYVDSSFNYDKSRVTIRLCFYFLFSGGAKQELQKIHRFSMNGNRAHEIETQFLPILFSLPTSYGSDTSREFFYIYNDLRVVDFLKEYENLLLMWKLAKARGS